MINLIQRNEKSLADVAEPAGDAVRSLIQREGDPFSARVYDLIDSYTDPQQKKEAVDARDDFLMENLSSF